MHAFVFPDEALARHAGRFVWLSVDTEKSSSAAFLERYPVEVWPSYFVIDPKSREVALRWAGSVTVPQLLALLDDAERAMKGGAGEAEALLAQADRAYGEDAKAQAAALYREALEKAPSNWPRRSRAVESMLLSLWGAKANAECGREARARVPKMEWSASRANAATLGLSCALDLAEGERGRREAIEDLERHVSEAIERATSEPPGFRIAADDVSGMFDALTWARTSMGDAAGARATAASWASYLEREALQAKTPEQRGVYDSHRLSAYVALGDPARAVPMLQASEEALPDDYNPPARLAYAYKLLGRHDEALAASERALKKVYGPRKLRVLQTVAEIHVARKDPAAARKTLEEALREWEALPEPQRYAGARERIQKLLASLPPAG